MKNIGLKQLLDVIKEPYMSLGDSQKVRINFIPDTSITITYRQWLAGLAMQGILSNADIDIKFIY